jgi:hypothetical protein
MNKFVGWIKYKDEYFPVFRNNQNGNYIQLGVCEVQLKKLSDYHWTAIWGNQDEC